MELEKLSCTKIGELVKTKQLSPVEVLLYFADRINSRNRAVNAFVYTKLEDALKEAKRKEQLIMQGCSNMGPFVGVPFALKDFLPSKEGWTHSYGGVKSLIQPDKYSSVFCDVMESIGGIAVGKTNAPSFGFRGTCDNKLYGPTRNPFNLEYNSGGSSGGSAAAVADGMIPIAEGGDAGGSIRVPAAWCNCFGFKPSAGAIPSVCRPDGWSATHPFCCNGGITKTVEDAAVLFAHMSGYCARDPYSVRIENHCYTPDTIRERYFKQMPTDLVIKVTEDFGCFDTDPEIRARIREISRKLSTVLWVDAFDFKYNYSLDAMADAWCQGISIDTAIELELWRRDGLDMIKDHRDELPEEFIYWNEQAANSDIMWMYHFNKIRTSVLDSFCDAFRSCDIILAPVTACNPVKNTSDNNTAGPNGDLIKFAATFPINFIGLPAASVPIGYSNSGLPIGMQIIGRRYHDWDVLRVAKAIETIMPWDYNKIPKTR